MTTSNMASGDDVKYWADNWPGYYITIKNKQKKIYLKVPLWVFEQINIYQFLKKKKKSWYDLF